MLWSMNHMMREDARRRFVIGFTIEKSDMRFWCCSRSYVFLSERFDVLTLSPDDDKSPQYDITVAGGGTDTSKVFRTKRMISDIGADTLQGRGTRVWEVVELDASGNENGGEICVLKDSWVDDDRDREGKIMAKMRANAKAAPARADDEYGRTPEGKKPKKCRVYDTINESLLTVITYGDVRAGQRPDKTRNWDLPRVVSLKSVRATSKASVIAQTSLQAAGFTAVETGTEYPRQALPEFSTKDHHRIVFKVIGFCEIPSLSLSFFCISEVAVALHELHRLGWVHRDISSGNILVVGVRPKIADLEYAKHEDELSMHSARKGTPYFMATEALATPDAKLNGSI
ncbi:hypothetical protein PHLGIDRAFT_122006 [Phlebiopsis gigantea 11061_1 CR5-6]|uniref:Protein kinase domain-containing protein n=1 Tax=Phlebiopsis gigantea (strain 11061_1 CR5-6) TaxID=745531 RepID=A0A0C3NEC1_PHLG1|nr:hypothetical protein PHLGIDRAFT_122006 [Phlebiopsis gigantea 11061_1 CR5-6]